MRSVADFKIKYKYEWGKEILSLYLHYDMSPD
jgi:hypothetical protein